MNREPSNIENRKAWSRLWKFIPASFGGATLAYCAFIFYLSSVPSFPVPPPFEFFDKIVHFCLYGGLSAIVAVGLQLAQHEYSARMSFIIPVGFSVIYGLTDEVHQLFVTSRTFAAADIAADAMGATVAAILLLVVRQRRKSGR